MATDRLQIEMPASVTDGRPIDLAQEQPFRLGELVVEPRSRELVARDGARHTLEPRVMQVLVALKRAEGTTVSRGELIRTCWKGTVVGDDSISRAISLLRRLSDEIGGEAFRIETISKIGYRLVVPGADPGRAGGGHASSPVRVLTRSRLLALAVIAAALTGALILWRPAPEGPTYSVNVQPFRISGAAQGFDEQLLSTLTSHDVPTTAGRIGLTLTGLVEERDGAITVNARLADPESDEVVWSGAITRSPTDPGGVAGAAAIIGSVAQCTLAGANDAGGPLPLDLLSGYARTCELGFRGQSAQGVRVARELTRRAPDFAAGWFALSHHAVTLYFRQPREDPELRAEALAAADKLIELRPNAQDGYVSKFVVMDPARIMERERLLLRATQLEPIYVDGAQATLGDFLFQVGRLEEAFQHHRTVQQQVPDVASAHARVFLAAAATGRWPIAEQALERVRQLDPAMVPALAWRKAVWQRNWAEAERLMPVDHPAQEEAGIAAYRALASGDPARKEAATRLVIALPADCCMRLRIEMLTLLGHRAEAIALLGRFDATRTPGTRGGLRFLSDPALRPLWYDPAIEPFFRSRGWIAYWNGAGVTPDLCKEARPPSFCRSLAG